MRLLVIPGGAILAAGELWQETATDFVVGDLVIPKRVLPAGYAFAEVEVPADFTIARYRFVDGQLVLVPLSAAERGALKEYAAEKRWEKENGGITLPDLGNVRIKTDDAAQRKISELRKRTGANEMAAPFGFKVDGGWVDVSKNQIVDIDKAVAAHVASCYLLQRQVDDAIDDGTIRTTAAIDAAFA